MAVPIAAVLILVLLVLYLVEKCKDKDKDKDKQVVPVHGQKDEKVAATKAELEQELENLKVRFILPTQTSLVLMSRVVSSHISRICPQQELEKEKAISTSLE